MAGAQDADELVVAADGDIYVGPVGTTAPTDATTAPAAAFYKLGFASEDGVTLTDSKTVEDIRAWQSFYSLRKIVTERDFQVAFVLRQWNYETVKLAFGGGTVTGGPTAYKYVPPSPETLDSRAVIIDAEDGSKVYRWYIPVAQVVESVEANFNRSSAADLPITLSVIGSGTANPWELFVSDAEFSAT